MSQFRPYAPNDKDWVVEQYKKKHGDDWGKDLVELMEGDLTGKTEETEEQPTGLSSADMDRIKRILRAQFNGCYVEGERKYLTELYEGHDEDGKPGILRKLENIQKAEPRLYPALLEQLRKELPLIAKIGGLT